jgi:hypothetical protein
MGGSILFSEFSKMDATILEKEKLYIYRVLFSQEKKSYVL